MIHKNKAFLIFLFLFSFFMGNVVSANENNCFVLAGEKYGVDPMILYAIADKESGLNPLAVNSKNRDKSKDFGLMQINEFWLKELKKYGIYEKDLFDPCISIHVGAWVLSQSIQIFGNNWEAVGAYNAGTAKTEEKKKLRKKYAQEIYNRYVRFNAR